MINLPRVERLSVRGPHGLGKSALCAWLIHWYALTRDGKDWKIVTTASVWRQLEFYLWPEVRKWARRIIWDRVGRPPYSESRELFSLKLRLNTGEAFAVASDDSEQIEGAHADHMLYIFDESKIVPDSTWNSVEGAFSTKTEKLWLSVSTPGEPVGRFFDIQNYEPGYEDWDVRHVTKDEVIAADRMDAQWAENRRSQWGEKSELYQNKVEGEFADAGQESMIPATFVNASMDRWKERYGEDLWEYSPFVDEVSIISVDVARYGGDVTVYALCGNVRGTSSDNPPDVFQFIEKGSQDTMQTAGDIIQLMAKYPNSKIVIDVIGVGAGVFDRVREVFEKEKNQPEQVDRLYSFIASTSTNWIDKSEKLTFFNTRSAAWWNMREKLDTSLDSTVCLPPNKPMRSELVAPHFQSMSNGSIRIETKKELRTRLDRSTNLADTIIMAYWDELFLSGMEYA